MKNIENCRETSDGSKNDFGSHSKPANLNVIPIHS